MLPLIESGVGKLFRVGVLLIASTSAVLAQGGYAVVSGIVRDASNAVVPGVTITAKNINTAVTLTSISNGVGHYTFTTLIPGLREKASV